MAEVAVPKALFAALLERIRCRQARRLDRHRGCSHESRDNGQWSSNVIEDGLDRHAAGGDFEKETRG